MWGFGFFSSLLVLRHLCSHTNVHACIYSYAHGHVDANSSTHPHLYTNICTDNLCGAARGYIGPYRGQI